MPAEAVQGLVQELKAENSHCPCDAAALNMQLEQESMPLLEHTRSNLRGIASAKQAAPSACETAFFSMTSIDECGDENGPLASQACSDACKPVACKMVAACPAGSTIALDSNQSMPAEAVQGLVQELKAEHSHCPCDAAALNMQLEQESMPLLEHTRSNLRGIASAKQAAPSACETAFFSMTSI